MNANKISLLLLLPMMLLSCKKDEDAEPALPPATQEGKNTFGCKVNGKNWVPGDSDWMATFLRGTLIDSTNLLSISGTQSSSNQGLGFYIKELPMYGNRNLFAPSGGWFRHVTSTSILDYLTDSSHNGSVTITKFDTINHIVSGTFHFRAKLQNSAETVNVTDGRFDIRYSKF